MSPVQLGVLASALPLVVFGVVGFTRWRLVGGLVVVMSAYDAWDPGWIFAGRKKPPGDR